MPAPTPHGPTRRAQDADANGPEGAAVLDRIADFVGRFVVLPDQQHGLTVIALWAAHTHAADAFYVTPRLVLDSAEPGSGKTRVLELLALVCRNPELVLSPTSAAIFRLIAEQPLTLLFDETDAVFNPKSSGNYEDLRALLNAGYKRGATIPRCVGEASKMKVHRFTVYSPVALAGIAGGMPATITTRAVTIHMRRRAAGETVEPFYERDAEREAIPLRDALATWIDSVASRFPDARPDMPDGVVDRPAEVWEALLAVADAAKGDWPKRAREACRYFVLDTIPAPPSLGVRLLADMRELFHDADRLTTVDILARLSDMEEAPWGDLSGNRPLDARRLAKELDRYSVAPAAFKDEHGKTVKGYTTYPTPRNVGLADAWARYLPAPADPSEVA
jgi:hypothetical protein